jgi:hypothetical protein
MFSDNKNDKDISAPGLPRATSPYMGRALAMTDHDKEENGKRHFKYPVASRHPFSTKRGINDYDK